MSEKYAKAAVWDVDGTLVDTAELHFQAWQAVSRELGREFSRTDFATTFGRRNPEILRTLFGDGMSDGELTLLGERKEARYRVVASDGVELLLGVRSLVEELHRAGFVQAIGSSAPHANLELILHSTGIAPYFGAVVGSEDTQRGKPDPQVFLLAAERLGVSPSCCVVFEDAVAGVEAARAARMKCVAVRCVGHHSEESLRQAGADLIVETLEGVSARTIEDLLG